MFDEKRMERVENKVEQINDSVVDLKIDVAKINTKLDTHISRIEDHILGDNKVINHIQPMVEKMPLIMEILEEYNYIKNSKLRSKAKLEHTIKKFTLVSVLLGIVYSIMRIFIS